MIQSKKYNEMYIQPSLKVEKKRSYKGKIKFESYAQYKRRVQETLNHLEKEEDRKNG